MEKEEAIREIKRFMSILPNDMQEAIMALVPELAESEDERIRKYFIWIVKNVLDNIQGLKLSEEQTVELIDNYSGIKESDMIAWLEKQKERKPGEIPPYVTGIKGEPDPPGISELEQAAARYERENRQSVLSSVDIVNAFIEGARWMEGRR